MKFGDFCAYVEYTFFKASSGSYTTYQALALTKMKSERAIKRSKAKTDRNFFIIHLAARCIPTLLLAVETAMDLNKMRPVITKEEEESHMQKGVDKKSIANKERRIRQVRKANQRLELEHAGENPDDGNSSGEETTMSGDDDARQEEDEEFVVEEEEMQEEEAEEEMEEDKEFIDDDDAEEEEEEWS